MTFEQHKEQTAKDCEAMADTLKKLAADVREGNIGAFERFWVDAGNEDGDALIKYYRDTMILRYYARREKII